MKEIINFFYEIGMLKRIKRSGWWAAGIKDPESVAEHSYRAAIIAYVIAKLENVNAEKAALICLFHDIGESRIGDLNKINARYINSKEAEKKAIKDQVSKLPENVKGNIISFFDEIEDKKTKEGIIAHDAEQLECAIQAKEYMEQGYNTETWIKNIKNNRLITKTARDLLETMEKTSSTDWWKGLKKIPNDRK